MFTTLYQEGTSLKNLHHMAQLYVSDRFQMYDYGPVLNPLVYGKNDERPPEIDLASIRVPLIIIGAETDEYCPPSQQERTIQELTNAPIYYRLLKGKGHSELVLGNDLTYFE